MGISFAHPIVGIEEEKNPSNGIPNPSRQSGTNNLRPRTAAMDSDA
jgi:hypothetical protein